jgi:hypothetical protein
MLLRYLSPEIDWEFVGLDERWREGVKSVFRNRSPDKNRRNPDPRDATFQLPVAN